MDARSVSAYKEKWRSVGRKTATALTGPTEIGGSAMETTVEQQEPQTTPYSGLQKLATYQEIDTLPLSTYPTADCCTAIRLHELSQQNNDH